MKTMMNSYLSQKLKSLSFILICLVVLLHAQFFDATSNQTTIFIQELFTHNITIAAVPFFFTISGFLLVFSLDKFHLASSFTKKIKKRFRTLAVPYLTYSILCLICAALLQQFTSLPISADKKVLDFSASDYARELFWKPTIAYQLWFVRDLFLMALLSPLFYLCLKYLREAFLLFVFIMPFIGLGLPIMTMVLFFILGMYIAMYHYKWTTWRFRSPYWWCLFISWILLCVFTASNLISMPLLSLISILLGIVSLWSAYDLLSNSFRERLATMDIISFSFLIYLLHEPMLTVIKKVYLGTIGIGTTVSELILYFGSPLITIIICYHIGKFWKSKAQRTYNLFTGGR